MEKFESVPEKLKEALVNYLASGNQPVQVVTDDGTKWNIEPGHVERIRRGRRLSINAWVYRNGIPALVVLKEGSF
jgi:hypothetical protein